jgi:drug/metabolite transporter (DMT)-like permease
MLLPLLGLVLFVPVLPMICIILGTRLTSGINTALLLQTELIFAYVICSVFFGERMKPRRLMGSGLILLGTLLILFQGGLRFAPGDLLIILGVSFYPWGNMCAKWLLRTLDPVEVLFLRSFFGGVVLLLLSLWFEGTVAVTLTSRALWLIFAYGIVVLVFSKICWYRGLARLSLLKATSLMMATPAMGVLFAAFFLQEVPSLFQVAGLVTTVMGLVLLTIQIPFVVERNPPVHSL